MAYTHQNKIKSVFSIDPEGDLILGIHDVSSSLIEALHGKEVNATILNNLITLDEDQDSASLAPTEPDPGPLFILVSTKHLVSASPYFANVLHPLSHPPVGRTTKSLKRAMEDTTAFIYMLASLHSRTGILPSRVPFTTLVGFTRAVHCYKCLEATKLVASQWIDALAQGPKRDDNEDQMAWLMIACVFRRNDIFRMATGALINESKGRIGADIAFPIPPRLLSTSPYLCDIY